MAASAEGRGSISSRGCRSVASDGSAFSSLPRAVPKAGVWISQPLLLLTGVFKNWEKGDPSLIGWRATGVVPFIYDRFHLEPAFPLTPFHCSCG